MILAIETATQICSVALFRDGQVIGLLESDEHNAHSRILHILIDRLFKESGTSLSDISAIAVSKGPGSYTGLRIGVSTAKGFCYAKDIPLIAINTLECMATGMREAIQQQKLTDKLASNDLNYLLIPMIDARRMEVYSAVFNAMVQPVRETEAEVITAESFAELRKSHTLILAGDGADKCREMLTGNDIIYLDDFNASARYMLNPAIDALNAKRFENVAYFEPFYLKDFIAGKPRVKGLD
jgi:tRNA threonylcarbamoyladenosine biosynthesis protein TsaB